MVLPAGPPADTQRGPQLIYIAGASRSGKTTLEHCLARNPQVQPSYEMATIDRAVLRVAQVLGMPNVVDPWFMDDVPADILRNVFMDYIGGICGGKAASHQHQSGQYQVHWSDSAACSLGEIHICETQ